MYLKAISVKGFKSFPDRARLDFGPGVSVVVGPNGSGKSNVTDAVLWAMGEQSPLAVRGQSMQDIIFGGGKGVKARSFAEVEIVLDNSDGTVEVPFTEISIMRRLDRSGEGEYRLNGARCRLADVIEVLSDTGLGKETHSVISQGRVEAIVTSKPRDRRLLIEEAAGLGKHRKRRRRAQLKLDHTQENLDRALEIEREARTRLRPLKRQAEAAELHERLERQTLEIRHRLAQEAMRTSAQALSLAEGEVMQARSEREALERRLAEVAKRRGRAETTLAARVGERDELSRRASRTRSSGERLKLRREQAQMTTELLTQRIDRVQRDLAAQQELVERDRAEGPSDAALADRIGALEGELAELERERETEIERELQTLEGERERAREAMVELAERVAAADEQAASAVARAQGARQQLREAERGVEGARREAAAVGAELAAVNQFLRSHARAQLPSATAAASQNGEVRALHESLKVSPGYELALAAALGGRLDAMLARDIAGAASILDGAGPDGGAILLYGDAGEGIGGGSAASPPTTDAIALIELVQASEPVMGVARRLLADAWVVQSLAAVPPSFPGIATTREGRVWLGAFKEVRQVPEGGTERVLARQNERDRLIDASEIAAQGELSATTAADAAREQLTIADGARESAEQAVRESRRLHAEAGERHRRSAWLIEQRRVAPDQGPLAVRRAQLEGELAAERRQAERFAREIAERIAVGRRMSAQLQADRLLAPLAARLAQAVAIAEGLCNERVSELDRELARDREADTQMSSELRRCAGEEAEIQGQLRSQGERVTTAEVAAQRLRDRVAELAGELDGLRERLGASSEDRPGAAATEQDLADTGRVEGNEENADAARPVEHAHPAEDPLPEPLSDEEREALSVRLQRLVRRREQLGPVNPLAKEEYGEAVAHVEELETRRGDLETAMRELRTVIRETDRQIQEIFQATFAAAAANFQELVKDVFPGGQGALRLVREEPAASSAADGSGEAGPEEGGQASSAGEGDSDDDDGGEILEGVEIEIAPAGKSAKRLSLLSGGEKSMTALAFLFAVFLAKPCPFYILDEVEAALDDLNLDRFLTLLRRYAGRAQFIVITHQKRTMDAADWLYGVSMGGDGVSKVLSRRLPSRQVEDGQAPEPVDRASGDDSPDAAAVPVVDDVTPDAVATPATDVGGIAAPGLSPPSPQAARGVRGRISDGQVPSRSAMTDARGLDGSDADAIVPAI